MKRKLISIILALTPCVCAFAQNYAIELLPDKKVIHVDNLGLAENTPIIEVLRMLPELTVREGEEYLSGYDVSLDDKSVAYNKDVLLSTMKLYEVEKIEISTSATASQQVNGMAGSIKIVSRTMKEGFSANLSVGANTLWDVYPNVNLNYRTDKLEVRGNVGLDAYSGKQISYYEDENFDLYQEGIETNIGKSFQETARLYMKYSPTKKDQFKVWILESFGAGRRNSFVNGTDRERLPKIGEDICRVADFADSSFSVASKLNFSAFARYEHTFRDEMKFSVTADFIQDKSRKGSLNLDGATPDKPSTLKSEAKFVLPFLPAGEKSLNLEMGGNIEYNVKDKTDEENKSFYSSPFMALKYRSGRWKVDAGIRYQYYDFVFDKSRQNIFNGGSKNITFNVNTLWQMADHQALRFFVTKNIVRPSSFQMYPVLEWDRSRGSYIIGNRDLRPSSMYSFDLDYITDWKAGDHNFVAEAGIGYDRADGLVNMVRRYNAEYERDVLTYVNTGVNDILKADADFLYRYGIFSVSLAANWYHNIKNEEGGKDDIDNFNISLSPIFCFRNSWTLSGTFRYNNAVISRNSRLGECFYSYFMLSKTLGKCIIFATFSDIFGYASENYEYREGGYHYTMYDQYPRNIEIGVTYRIGR